MAGIQKESLDYKGPDRRRRKSVKKILGTIGFLNVLVIANFGAYHKIELVPDIILWLSILVLSMFGIKSASLLIDKKIGGNNEHR